MKKRIMSMLLAALMVLGLLAGCGGNNDSTNDNPGAPSSNTNTGSGNQTSDPATGGDAKEAPMLAEQVSAGTLPVLAERLPSEADVYVETDNNPNETPAYGGTLRTPNNGLWTYGPICEEPLFRLLDDGSVAPNVAKGYDVSDDGLVYTIHLREGMKWSDGTPFTATDCVYYYNYILVTDVDNATGRVTRSNCNKWFNWYLTTDPADGLSKPAQLRYVDDTTFTITLYSPKPTLLQAICIDNKWMFCPKEWYKDITANDASQPHWTGETDLKLIGGEGLPTLTEAEAMANAKARNSLYTFDDYTMYSEQLAHCYWQYAGRPTLRPWNISNSLTDQVLVFERNPYFWKVDAEGRQLPYADELECVTMDKGLWAQEMIAGNLDFLAFGSEDFPTYKASEAASNYIVTTEIAPNWSSCSLQLNQAYKDAQYAELFANIDFRHALSIAVNREEMNSILFNDMLTPAQFASPLGTAYYIEGATEKWIEYDVDQANSLLDGIEGISSGLNADGFRTFVGGANDGKALVLEIDTRADSSVDGPCVALLAQYYKDIGIQVVESSNTDSNARNARFISGDIVMSAIYQNDGSFNVMLRPDAVAANRNNVCFTGFYALEHQNPRTPEPGSAMEELVNATMELQSASTIEALQDAAMRITQSHNENTWSIGYLVGNAAFHAVNNRVHNFPQGWVNCDELRFYGYAKPYSWFIQD